MPADFLSMTARARILAFSIALMAMTLRALVPMGWMPAAGSGPLVLCTIEGRAHIALDSDGKPVKQTTGQGSEHQLCSFGAAANLALSDAASAPAAPVANDIAHNDISVSAPAIADRHAPQSPRAPPYSS